ncbi:CHC2 zinc finger domain-containing protein [Pelagicoccus sp. SDUM812003]|uniref:CHC2 zinc finger domain-containing protein n=1 Tax=Pelagicoccus sp. SDUM812003 TaxID=3041267 RepID=UPI00280E2D28|nr:CHC2 zinc finger domain-containing protein [Pelagicoccus sp. SDUM812003]MDQ8203352.1 CHC2 zinc finger domain-containing protein [Pelagicoccus sp. SDUM812003]
MMKDVNVDRLRSAIDIVRHIQKTVPLSASNHGYLMGKCPWSRDGRIIVSHELKSFTCPETGEFGDVLDFERKLHGLSFKQALKRLAFAYGTAISPSWKSRKLKSGRVRPKGKVTYAK